MPPALFKRPYDLLIDRKWTLNSNNRTLATVKGIASMEMLYSGGKFYS